MQYVKSFEKKENKNLLFKTFANTIKRLPTYSWASSLHTIQKEVYILPAAAHNSPDFKLLFDANNTCSNWINVLSIWKANNKQTNKHKIIIASNEFAKPIAEATI